MPFNPCINRFLYLFNIVLHEDGSILYVLAYLFSKDFCQIHLVTLSTFFLHQANYLGLLIEYSFINVLLVVLKTFLG